MVVALIEGWSYKGWSDEIEISCGNLLTVTVSLVDNFPVLIEPQDIIANT